MTRLVCLLTALATGWALPAFGQSADGAATYQAQCSQRHTAGRPPRAPGRDALRLRRPETVLENNRFQSTAQAGLTAAQVPSLTLRWAFGFPDASSAWAQPAIAGGRVYVYGGFGGRPGNVLLAFGMD